MNDFPSNILIGTRIKRWRGLFLCLILAGCLGCAPRPKIPLFDQAPSSPEEYLAHQIALQSSVHSLRAVAQTTFHYEDKTGSAEQVVLICLPDRARIEVLNFLGLPTAFVSLQGKEVTVLSQSEKTCWRGESTEENMGRFLPVPLSGNTIVLLLLGQVELSGKEKPSWFGPEKENTTTLIIQDTDGEGVRHLDFHQDSRLLSKADVYHKNGLLLWQAIFSDYRMVGDIPFPFTIRLEAPWRGTWLEIEYSEVELNASLEDRLFELKIPEGMTIVDLD